MKRIKRAADRVLSVVLSKPADASSPPLMASCALFLDLYCPPNYETYNPGTFMKGRFQPFAEKSLSDRGVVFDIEPVADCRGGLRQIHECLQLLLSNIAKDAETTLYLELFQEGDTPCISIVFEGVATIPADLAPGPFLSIPFEEFRQRWTAATNGGRIDPVQNGLLLRLKGVRVSPESFPELIPARDKIEEAVATCNAGVSPAPAVMAAMGALGAMGAKREPADIKTLVHEVSGGYQAELEERNIDLDVLFGTAMPPIAIYREQLRNFFEDVFEYAECAVVRGGSLSILFDYSVERRAAEAAATIEGCEPHDMDEAFLASMKRLITEVHDGTFESTMSRKERTITFSLPDPVGQALDEWIPGCEVFSARSKQVLRLLKSGGQAPPEDLLLPGVLEEELEQWLLPLLDTPQAVNVAHELAEAPKIQSLSKERLKKTLEQIKKGKLRKEIAKPPYAAEILNAFRQTERARIVLGEMPVEDIQRLCEALLAFPPPCAECLRLIARARQ